MPIPPNDVGPTGAAQIDPSAPKRDPSRDQISYAYLEACVDSLISGATNHRPDTDDRRERLLRALRILCSDYDTTARMGAAVARSSVTMERSLMGALEVAWGVIANAGGGDWTREHPDWQEAAARWRDQHWHPALDRHGDALRATSTRDGALPDDSADGVINTQ